MWGRRGITQRGRGYSLARMQKRLFRGPADRACDIIGSVACIVCIYTGGPREYGPAHAHTHTCTYNIAPSPIIIPANQIFHGRISTRAHAHERADSIPTYLPVLFRRCSADLIFDYATMRSLDRQSRGKSGARSWNTHDASTSSKGSARHGQDINF